MPLSKVNVAEIIEMIKSVADPLMEKIKKLENDCENMRKVNENQRMELSSVRDAWREKNIFLEEKIAILETKFAKNTHDPTNIPSPFASPPTTALHDKRSLLLQEKVNLLERKCDDMDQYSKHTNLIVDGIQMCRGETPDQLRQTLLQEIERLDLEIDDSEVDRAHRTSAPYRDTNGKLQQAVIVHFVSWGAHNVMHQSRKSSKYYFRASLTNERQSTLIYARKQIETDLSVASHIKFVFADKNCRLQASCVNGRLLSFTTADEFDGLVNYLDLTTKNNQLLPQVSEKYELTLSEDIKE